MGALNCAAFPYAVRGRSTATAHREAGRGQKSIHVSTHFLDLGRISLYRPLEGMR